MTSPRSTSCSPFRIASAAFWIPALIFGQSLLIKSAAAFTAVSTSGIFSFTVVNVPVISFFSVGQSFWIKSAANPNFCWRIGNSLLYRSAPSLMPLTMVSILPFNIVLASWISCPIAGISFWYFSKIATAFVTVAFVELRSESKSIWSALLSAPCAVPIVSMTWSSREVTVELIWPVLIPAMMPLILLATASIWSSNSSIAFVSSFWTAVFKSVRRLCKSLSKGFNWFSWSMIGCNFVFPALVCNLVRNSTSLSIAFCCWDIPSIKPFNTLLMFFFSSSVSLPSSIAILTVSINELVVVATCPIDFNVTSTLFVMLGIASFSWEAPDFVWFARSLAWFSKFFTSGKISCTCWMIVKPCFASSIPWFIVSWIEAKSPSISASCLPAFWISGIFSCKSRMIFAWSFNSGILSFNATTFSPISSTLGM